MPKLLPALPHIRSPFARPMALPSLRQLLEGIAQLSADCTSSEVDRARARQDEAALHATLRRMGSPRRAMPQNEHCVYLSRPRTVAQPPKPELHKQIQLKRQRNVERRIAAELVRADASRDGDISLARRGRLR